MTSQWTRVDLGYSSVAGVDPAVEWALAEEGVDDFFPTSDRDWMPILVQFKDDQKFGARDFQDGKRIADAFGQIWQDAVHVPRLHTLSPSANENVRFCTALVTRRFFDLVWREKEVRKNYERFIERVSLGLPLDHVSRPPPVKPGDSP